MARVPRPRSGGREQRGRDRAVLRCPGRWCAREGDAVKGDSRPLDLLLARLWAEVIGRPVSIRDSLGSLDLGERDDRRLLAQVEDVLHEREAASIDESSMAL